MATIVTRSGKGSPLTHAEVDSNFTNLNTDKLELSGGTMTGNLSFGDNDKAIFGAGSDLQIYHDGSNSYISEVGTGDLYVRGSNFYITKPDGSLYFSGSNSTGEAGVYFNNSKKLATTSTGVDITGTITSDGLTVDSSSFVAATFERTTVGGGSALQLTNGDDNAWQVISGGDETYSLNYIPNGGSTRPYFKASSGGDISFYEDTGTTAKFFWDASVERLGIGTSSPDSNLHIEGSGSTSSEQLLSLVNGGGDAGAGSQLWLSGTNATTRGAYIEGQAQGTDNRHDLIFATGGSGSSPTERMRIDSSGNVGIGTSSPDSLLEVEASAGARIRMTDTGTQSYTIGNVGTSFNIYNESQASEAMRIDSSGNVGIGTSSPAVRLDVEANTAALLDLTRTGVGSYRLAISSSDKFSVYDVGQDSDRLVIDSSGQVGIGTSSPAYKFHQHESTSGANYHLFTNLSTGSTTGDGFRVGIDSNEDALLWLREGNSMKFATSDGERMRIDSSGRVGIGTSSPSDQLDISGSSPVIRLSDTTDSSYSRIEVYSRT